MLGGFVIIMAFLFAGEAVSAVGVPLPGNVVGMILLAVALRLHIIKREWIRGAAELLVDNLSLLFVPAGVGVMAFFDVIQRSWLPISISILASTLLILVFAGVLQDRLHRLLAHCRRDRKA